MRWIDYDPRTVRTARGFLWLPKSINGDVRWLEIAAWTESYCDRHGWTACRWEAA